MTMRLRERARWVTMLLMTGRIVLVHLGVW